MTNNHCVELCMYFSQCCLNKLLPDSVEEQKVIDEINKLEDENMKEQEEARKLIDEIVAQVEHTCGANTGTCS